MFTRRFFLRKILSRVNIYPFVEKALGAFPISLCRSTFGAIADRYRYCRQQTKKESLSSLHTLSAS